MDRQLLEAINRIPSSEALKLEPTSWLPPTINAAGHLVYAESRAPSRREVLEHKSAPASATSQPAAQPEPSDAGTRGYEDGFEIGKKEGLQAGKQEGLAQGKQEATQTAQQELQPKLHQLNQLLTGLSHSLNQEDYKLEQTLLNLVQIISEAVVGRELKTDKGLIMQTIRDCIGAMPPSKDNVRIKLHPEDKQFAEEAIAEGGENWRVIADASISRGGCVVETDQSIADCSLESRFQAVLDQLQEHHAVSPKPGDPDFEEAPAPAVVAQPEKLSQAPTAEQL